MIKPSGPWLQKDGIPISQSQQQASKIECGCVFATNRGTERPWVISGLSEDALSLLSTLHPSPPLFASLCLSHPPPALFWCGSVLVPLLHLNFLFFFKSYSWIKIKFTCLCFGINIVFSCGYPLNLFCHHYCVTTVHTTEVISVKFESLFVPLCFVFTAQFCQHLMLHSIWHTVSWWWWN